MKLYDVIVERHNGIYHASVPTLPNLSVEGSTRDEAVTNAKKAIEEFFKSAEAVTVAVDVPAEEFRPYTKPSDMLRWMALHSRPATPLDDEFEAELAAEKQRQREEAELEFELAESEYPHAERWLRAANIAKKDPNDPKCIRSFWRNWLPKNSANAKRRNLRQKRKSARSLWLKAHHDLRS